MTHVKYERVYQKSYATRDWFAKLQIIDETRMICLEHDQDVILTSISVNENTLIQIKPLNELGSKLKSKDDVFSENNFL